MKIKKAKIPPQFSNRRLLWSLNFSKEKIAEPAHLREIEIGFLEGFHLSDFLSKIPDPLFNVMGVTMEPMDLLCIDRSFKAQPQTSRAPQNSQREYGHQNGPKTTRNSRNQEMELPQETLILPEKKTSKNTFNLQSRKIKGKNTFEKAH